MFIKHLKLIWNFFYKYNILAVQLPMNFQLLQQTHKINNNLLCFLIISLVQISFLPSFFFLFTFSLVIKEIKKYTPLLKLSPTHLFLQCCVLDLIRLSHQVTNTKSLAFKRDMLICHV